MTLGFKFQVPSSKFQNLQAERSPKSDWNLELGTWNFSSACPEDLQEVLQQRRHFCERNHVRAIAQRAVGLRMGFDEHAVRSRGERAAREHGRELALAAR